MEEKDLRVHCYHCLSNEKLRMLPHRKQGKMVGWVFLCENCEPVQDFLEALEASAWTELVQWPQGVE